MFHDREPKPRPPARQSAGRAFSARAASGPVGAVEALENVREVLGWYSGSEISHAQNDIIIFLDDAHKNFFMGAGMLYRVGHKVERRLFYQSWIGVDLQTFGTVEFDGA